jgi:hypothetical protein
MLLQQTPQSRLHCDPPPLAGWLDSQSACCHHLNWPGVQYTPPHDVYVAQLHREHGNGLLCVASTLAAAQLLHPQQQACCAARPCCCCSCAAVAAAAAHKCSLLRHSHATLWKQTCQCRDSAANKQHQSTLCDTIQSGGTSGYVHCWALLSYFWGNKRWTHAVRPPAAELEERYKVPPPSQQSLQCFTAYYPNCFSASNLHPNYSQTIPIAAAKRSLGRSYPVEADGRCSGEPLRQEDQEQRPPQIPLVLPTQGTNHCFCSSFSLPIPVPSWFPK